MSYTVTNIFATQSGNVPVSQLDTNFTNVLLGVNNAYLVGTLAARPAPDGVGNGRYYFATDVSGGTLYRDNGSAWVAVSPGVNSGTVAIVPNTLINVGISATVSGNNLTITLTDGSGSTITASNPAYIAFRNATLTTGFPSQITLTSAPSLTISNTVTLGTTNAVPYRLYIVAMNNAGTVELAVWNPVSGSTLLGLNESNLYSSSTPGNSAQTLYSTTARSNVAVRILGYLEISEATAGTWATAPTVIQVMGPGVKRTGDLVQSIYASTASQTSSISSSWASIGITHAIALTSAFNPVRIMGAVNGIQKDAANVNNAVGIRLVWNTTNVYALFQNQAAFTGTAVINNVSVPFGGLHFAGISSITYDVQFNSFNNTGTVYVQVASSTSYLLLEEVFQ